ncbi:MAG: hypothetical protein AB7F86_13340 [Bdellovibrionales bacterium]
MKQTWKMWGLLLAAALLFLGVQACESSKASPLNQPDRSGSDRVPDPDPNPIKPDYWGDVPA